MEHKWFVALVLFCLTSCDGSEIVGRSHLGFDADGDIGVCTGSTPDALQSKSSSSDVILTGTVLEVLSAGRVKSDRGHSGADPAAGRNNGTAVGRVKVWRIMKGSVDDVTRSRRRRRSSGKKAKRSPDEKVTVAGQENPVLEIYGMRNNLMCGSFLKEGETRVFFLKKLQDHREPRSRRRRSGKRKKGRGRKRKNAVRVRGAGGTEAGGFGRRSKDADAEISDSMGTVWKRFLRGEKKKKKKRSGVNKEKRKKRSKKIRSLLLLSNEPSRITLQALDSVAQFTTT